MKVKECNSWQLMAPRPKDEQRPIDARVLNSYRLRNVGHVKLFWSPTPSGPRYAVAYYRVNLMDLLDLDNGYKYGTYEEAAVVFTRTIMEDEPEED